MRIIAGARQSHNPTVERAGADRGPASAPAKAARVASVDLLRGVAMIIMALDHVRDFISGASFDPTDVEHTTPAAKSSFMLLTRGLWLILAEFTIIRFAWSFDIDSPI
jgi:uncharacterized membrane protein